MGAEEGTVSLYANHWKTKILSKENLNSLFKLLWFLNKHCHFWKQFYILTENSILTFPGTAGGFADSVCWD